MSETALAGTSLPFGSEFSPSQIGLRQLLELIATREGNQAGGRNGPAARGEQRHDRDAAEAAWQRQIIDGGHA